MIRPLYMDAPSRRSVQQEQAYDQGRHDFQSANDRAQNPYLRTNFTATYHIAVVGWYRGWDAEHEKARCR